jgi:catechol 2,3-dioxygenase-like lactoylglutathione lyase family enzyme
VTPIRLDQVNLVVRDVAASRAFYSRLGLDFGGEHDPVWADHHVGAERGEHTPIDVDLDSTSFAQKWDAGWPGGTGVVIGFKVDSRHDVDEVVAASPRTASRCNRRPSTPSGAPATPSSATPTATAWGS